jgi:hypothetical protein
VNNLKLPDIEPSGPITSAADSIDRAGGKVKQAADQLGSVMLEADMADVAVQHQEATLRAAKGLTDTLHLIRSTPYLGRDQAEALVGAESGVRLDEDYVRADGSTEKRPRAVIPMHEVASILFDRQAAAVMENASQAINAPGWKSEFRRAAAKDVERARAEALDWQRAQRLADAEVRTEAQLSQAAASRNWALYGAILDTPENQLNVQKREAYRANLPRIQTEAQISDRLRAGTPAELDGLISDIAANDKFPAPLSAEQQFNFTARARERKREMDAEEERARRRAEEQRFEAFGDRVQTAVNEAQKTGRSVSSLVSVTDIPLNLKFDEFTKYKSFLEAVSNKERKTDNRAWLELANADKDGKLGTMSRAQIMNYWPYLSEQDARTWMDRWAAAKEPGAGAGKPMFSDTEDATINHVLSDYYKIDSKKEPILFDSAKAQLQRNLLVWRKTNPDVPMLYDVVRTEAARTTFTANTDLNRAVLTNAPDSPREWVKKYLGDGDAGQAWMTLNLGVRAAQPDRPVSDQDVFTHLQQMDGERPLVSEAWNALNPAAALDGTARAAIHSVLINPRALAAVDAQLAAEKKEPNQRNRVYRIVQDMQVPQSAPLAAANEEKARQEAERRQVVAAGAELRAKQEAETAAQKAAREAAEKTERERVAKLPYPLQLAERYAREQFAAQEGALERQIRGRVEAEDRAAQIAANGGREYGVLGKRFAEDPVRIEMERRIKAELEVGRAARQTEWDAQQREARDAYLRYWEANMRADDGSVRMFAPPGFIDNFERWQQARREGKL